MFNEMETIFSGKSTSSRRKDSKTPRRLKEESTSSKAMADSDLASYQLQLQQVEAALLAGMVTTYLTQYFCFFDKWPLSIVSAVP